MPPFFLWLNQYQFPDANRNIYQGSKKHERFYSINSRNNPSLIDPKNSQIGFLKGNSHM